MAGMLSFLLDQKAMLLISSVTDENMNRHAVFWLFIIHI